VCGRSFGRRPPAAHRGEAGARSARRSTVPMVERHTRTSQVKALPPEVVSVGPARRGFPLTSVMRPTSVASGADMKPGNRKGTNPGPPDRTRRTRRTAIVLRTPPRVLNGTAANCDPPFGTKRPQVQILSPRPCSRRPEALPLPGWGLRFGPYRNEVPQRCSSEGLSQPAQRFAGRSRAGVRIDIQRHRTSE
jgi:hypothetical protein